MKISRCSVSDVSADRVNRLVGDSLFGSVGFLNLWRHCGGNPVYWIAENEGTVIALLPGVEFGVRLLRRFQAMPDGCYGRVFFNDESSVDREEVARLLLQAIAGAGYLKAFIYDFYGCFERSRGFTSEQFRTSLVDLTGEKRIPPDKKMQSEIRKAVRENVTYERFDPDRHFDKFISLMTQAERRHGRAPKYSPPFFKALSELSRTDDRVIWYWCEHQGRPVTSHINFVEGDMALHWQVYYDRRFSSLKANQYILYRTAQETWEREIRYLNLGWSPPEAAGLAPYKEKWGGRSYTYNCYVRRSLLGRLL